MTTCMTFPLWGELADHASQPIAWHNAVLILCNQKNYHSWHFQLVTYFTGWNPLRP